MKKSLNLCLLVLSSFVLSGCLAYKDQTVKFDYQTGILETSYTDIRSTKENADKEDHVAKDWAKLKEMLNKKDDYDPEVISVKSKEIFEKDNVLSGTAVYQVQCPKCFASKLDVLKRLDLDGEWQLFNDEIFLVFPERMPVVSTNGKLLKTEKNTICVWPQDATQFEYTISHSEMEGESLLTSFLNESKK